MILVNHQPHYLASVQFFSRMKRCDYFILADNVQFEKGDWQNRNRILHPQGVKLLTIPVKRGMKKIQETELVDHSWIKQHEDIITQAYSKSLGWINISKYLRWARVSYANSIYLGDVTLDFIDYFYRHLGFKNSLYKGSIIDDNREFESPSHRLYEECKSLDCNTYLCGESGWKYINRLLFEDVEIKRDEWVAKEYPQNSKEFIPNLSILDLISAFKTLNEVYDFL